MSDEISYTQNILEYYLQNVGFIRVGVNQPI